MRKGSKLQFFIYGLIGLAGIGLIAQLFTNTTNFLLNIFITAIFGVVIFGVLYYFVLGGRNKSSDDKKYKQALRQSKTKYTQHRTTAPTVKNQQQTTSLKKRGKKRPSHLRVIDGNKSKRKKRVSN